MDRSRYSALDARPIGLEPEVTTSGCSSTYSDRRLFRAASRDPLATGGLGTAAAHFGNKLLLEHRMLAPRRYESSFHARERRLTEILGSYAPPISPEGNF